jgi:predicted RND superfamily exporter protein
MAKGVLFGLVCVITVLPALILTFNKAIEKTKHKEVLPKFKTITKFVTKHYIILAIAFVVILPIAYYGYKHTEVYYKLDASLPESLASVSANKEVKEKFKIV